MKQIYTLILLISIFSSSFFSVQAKSPKDQNSYIESIKDIVLCNIEDNKIACEIEDKEHALQINRRAFHDLRTTRSRINTWNNEKNYIESYITILLERGLEPSNPLIVRLEKRLEQVNLLISSYQKRSLEIREVLYVVKLYLKSQISIPKR